MDIALLSFVSAAVLFAILISVAFVAGCIFGAAVTNSANERFAEPAGMLIAFVCDQLEMIRIKALGMDDDDGDGDIGNRRRAR